MKVCSAASARFYDLAYDENGTGYLSEVNEGSKGYDLELSIDARLQQKLDEILTQVLTEYKDDPLRPYMDRIMYVLQDPNTGDILAISCMIRNADGSISASPTSIYTDAYAPGSVVKGATVYMGLDQGVIQPGEKILDNYIKIKDTPIKKSWKTLVGLTMFRPWRSRPTCLCSTLRFVWAAARILKTIRCRSTRIPIC